jgi:branched-chain amino acid transport system ATP-binding protein
MLKINNIDVHYGQAHVLQGVTLDVGIAPVAIVGRNGMGKTTLCQSIMGMIQPSGGSVQFNGQELLGKAPNEIARQGIAIVPQGRRCFASLSVHEHLELVSQGPKAAWNIERIYATFPRLAERKKNGGTQLSGGEQQMLSIARALLMNPRLVIMDEPSEGLAPVIVEQLVKLLRKLPSEGIALLLVEQQLALATSVCDDVAIMVNGRICATMTSAELIADTSAQQRFLGVASHETHHS